MPKYEISEENVIELKQFIDVGVKSMGLQVAEAGLKLVNILNNPIEETEVKVEEV